MLPVGQGEPCAPRHPQPRTRLLPATGCWLLPCSRISGLASAEIGSCLGAAFHFRMHSTRSSAHDIVINIWKDLLFLYKQQQHIAEAQLLAAELPGSLPQPCQGQEPQPPPMFLTSPHAEGLPGMPDVTLIHPRLWRLLVPPSRPASYKKASLKPPKFGQSTARELSSLHLCSPGSARRGGAHRGRPSTQDTTASPSP